jgi:hypothetical protein
MATGRLGVADLAATTYTTLYTVPADTFTVATISLCNRGATTVNVRVAVTTTGGPSAPANEEFIEYDVQLSAKGTLERTGIVLDAGKIISVYASAVNVSAVTYGIETSTI